MLTNRKIAELAGYTLKVVEHPHYGSGSQYYIIDPRGKIFHNHFTEGSLKWPNFLGSLDAALTLPFDDDVKRGLICDPGYGWVYVRPMTFYWDTVPRVWHEHPARAICETWAAQA